MNSERRMLGIAVALLLVQLLWLAFTMDFLRPPSWMGYGRPSEKNSIGKIVKVYNNTRTRSAKELVWQDGEELQPVFAQDVLLTLKNSGMRVRLQNGSELNLSENTLVYLEKLSNDEKDERIRIRFSHGNLRSRLADITDDLSTESWVINPEKNSELEIKTLSDGQVELGVNKGHLSATSSDQHTTVQLNSNETIALKGNDVVSKNTVSEQIRWTGDRDHLRVYASQFPTTLTLSWLGEPEKLEIYSGGQLQKSLPLREQKNSLALSLPIGIYEFRLRSKELISSWLMVDVWQAPIIHLMSPLPRDRYAISENLNYLWLNPYPGMTSKFEMTKDPQFNEPGLKKLTSADSLQQRGPAVGKFYWRVTGVDADGFEVPAPYVNPIYFEQNPMDAPKLQAPILQHEEEPKTPQSSLFPLWWRILWQAAPAQAADGPVVPGDLDLIFTWSTVPDADHYTIEISEKSDFRDLLIEKNLHSNRFVWKKCKFSGKEFYWRVAGGSSTIMGRFSDISRVDYAQLMNTGEAPGIQARVHSLAPAAPKTEQVEPPAQTTVTPTAPQPSTAQAPLPQPSPQQQPVYKYFDAAESLAWGAMGYDYSSWTDSAGTGMNFSGYYFNVGYKRDFQLNEKWRSCTWATLQLNQWKDIDSSSTANGSSLHEIKLRVLQIFAPSTSAWGYSLGGEQNSVPVRTGLESISFQTQSLASLGVWYDFGAGPAWHGKTALLLNTNFNVNEAAFLFTGYKTLGSLPEAHWQLGEQLEIDHATTSSGSSGNQILVNIFLGRSW